MASSMLARFLEIALQKDKEKVSVTSRNRIVTSTTVMLKHVHVSPYSSCRSNSASGGHAKTSSSAAMDTVSLNSSISYGSSQDAASSCLSSRSSSASIDSLPESSGCSSSSSSSSVGGMMDGSIVKQYTTPVKVYASVLRSDIEYITLSITYKTTSKDVIHMALNKFKMKHRDPNLFFLTMEVGIRRTGLPMRTVMVLDEEARPAELQSCHPLGHSKFSLQMNRGGLVKVHDSCLMAGSQYKSLLISERTTVEELVQLLLNCYNCKERTFKFSLYEVCKLNTYERQLHPADYPLLVQQEWPSQDIYSFQIKRNPDSLQRKKFLWQKTFDVAGNINFRLHFRDEVSPKIIHSPTLKPSHNDYENYFYI